ncbi:ubiquinone/menaquinone biosynthesis C-methylase UbiE [Spinactinospora alkalitolerans]|uniref:Ubiquinone/menaquinone biosynthesis C-methylase UbiE n=1 Tax=Spinactinospora alkalitolerans TaxID=687207 RepID=A0A852TUP8_9ACTN|nr:class I SAM-dependent methyltransferase [Spinactinospora alkalitolerans]NYE47401.1 ubiquinone/menaquinone biosynthesis C-methylase UbiE [Spinactinospora alkalitolerans]
MAATHNEILKRVYALNGPEEAQQVYDAWAENYDADTVEGMGYVAPALAAARLAELLDASATVLDAGCGTGLAGAALAERCDALIDGVDLSAGMLERARSRGVYRALSEADLTRRLDVADGGYDALLCVGTLTDGHVGPAALDEFARVVRPGGVVVATVLSAVWESGGYRSHLEEMARRGLVRLRELEERPYHEREGLSCRLCVLEVR